MLPCPDEDALGLLNDLLQFNPNKRITAEHALQHVYMSRFHCPDNEPTLDHDIVPIVPDSMQLSVQNYQDILYKGISQTRATMKSETGGAQPPAPNILHSVSDAEPVQTASSPDIKCPGSIATPQSPSLVTHHKSLTRATKPKDSDRPRLHSATHLIPTPPVIPSPDLTLISARIIPSTRPQHKKLQSHGVHSQYTIGSYGTISQTTLRHLQQMTKNDQSVKI